MQTDSRTQVTQPKTPLFMFRFLSALAGGSQPHLALKALPTLLTDCVILGHAEKADVIFTPRQWFAMCAHMMNENPSNFFLMPYQDKDGNAKFAKAYKAKADERINWSWNTITGKAKNPASIGFYPTNGHKQSRWAAMDFDSHDDEPMRARDLAHKAFAVLIREPQLYVALTTSAGDPHKSGWHLFIFTEQFYPCEEWTRLLKQVAAQIDAPIQSGICEIFPDDCRGIGHGIRAPGTWNPKTGECGLVLRQTVTKLLPAELPSSSPKDNSTSLCLGELRREKNLSSPIEEFFRGEHGEWATRFAITAPNTRHQKLRELVGAAYHQAGREVAKKNAEIQYAEANPVPESSLEEHLVDFENAWDGLHRRWLGRLSAKERQKCDSLTTETERDAFRILRNWAQTDSPDFKVHCRSLGNRVGISWRGASKLRDRFCLLGILRKTAPYVRKKLAARYEWVADKL
jgi:hypothetical protein